MPRNRFHPNYYERGGATLAEVGAALGVSRERARQIESVALKKAKGILEARGYCAEDLLPGLLMTHDYELKLD